MAEELINFEITQLISENQSMLFAYILSLMGDPASASDVLQETNLVLWRKAAELPSIDNPGAWARKIAYFQVLAHRKRQQRDRLIFDDELIAELAVNGTRQMNTYEDRLAQLRVCMTKLEEDQRRALLQRYGPGGSVQTLAKEMGRSVGAVSQMLYRVRASLQSCITRNMREAAG